MRAMTDEGRIGPAGEKSAMTDDDEGRLSSGITGLCWSRTMSWMNNYWANITGADGSRRKNRRVDRQTDNRQLGSDSYTDTDRQKTTSYKTNRKTKTDRKQDRWSNSQSKPEYDKVWLSSFKHHEGIKICHSFKFYPKVGKAIQLCALRKQAINKATADLKLVLRVEKYAVMPAAVVWHFWSNPIIRHHVTASTGVLKINRTILNITSFNEIHMCISIHMGL